MRYRLLATYQGAPYEAGVGPDDTGVVLFAACPPPEDLRFEPATGHWRKRVSRAEVQMLYESRPVGMFRGERCVVLDDLGDRLHIVYLGHDAYRAEQLGYWEVDRGVFELITPRQEVTEIVELRLSLPQSGANGFVPDLRTDSGQFMRPTEPPGQTQASFTPRAPVDGAPGGWPAGSGRSGGDPRISLPPADVSLPPADEAPLPLEAEAMRAASAASRRSKKEQSGSGERPPKTPVAQSAGISEPPTAEQLSHDSDVHAVPSWTPQPATPHAAQAVADVQVPPARAPLPPEQLDPSLQPEPSFAVVPQPEPAGALVAQEPAAADVPGTDHAGTDHINPVLPAQSGPTHIDLVQPAATAPAPAPPQDQAPVVIAARAAAPEAAPVGLAEPAPAALPEPGPAIRAKSALAAMAKSALAALAEPVTEAPQAPAAEQADQPSPGSATAQPDVATPTAAQSSLAPAMPRADLTAPAAVIGQPALAPPVPADLATPAPATAEHEQLQSTPIAAHADQPASAPAAAQTEEPWPAPAAAAGDAPASAPATAEPPVAAPATAEPAIAAVTAEVTQAPVVTQTSVAAQGPAVTQVAAVPDAPPQDAPPQDTPTQDARLQDAILPAADQAPAIQEDSAPDTHPASQPPPTIGRRRRATRRRLPTQRIFSDLATQAAIPATAYAIGEDVDGAMCLIRTDEGFEVFNSAVGARHEVRVFEDEESAYFYLFGVLVAEAVRTGALVPRD